MRAGRGTEIGDPRVGNRMIVIVEDEPDIASLIEFHVEREGYGAEVFESGQKALDAIRRRRPDLVILDLMLPDLDGMEVCRRLKWDEAHRAIPILIVSAKGEESDIVAGLELGADDYVTKPFSPKVLMARVRNLLRRAEQLAESAEPRAQIRVGSGALLVDLDRRQVLVDGDVIELTRTEFEILRTLITRPGFVHTRDQIIAAVHGDRAVLSGRTVDVHVTAIRRKLGRVGAVIRTVRGVGYRIDEDALQSVDVE